MFKTGLKSQPFHKPVKKFGQNFLVDSNVIDRIISEIKPDKKTTIIEIGPGTGAITKRLCPLAKKVIAIELDKKLASSLNDEKIENLQVINKDVLDVNIKELMNDKEDYIIFGNVPYYISSKIIALTLRQETAKKAIFMVQKEMYERITAPCKTSDYSSFTVFCRMLSESSKIIDVSRNSFSPKPNVESALIKFDINNKFPHIDPLKFDKFLKKCFGQKRKMILNNLKNYYDKKTLIDTLGNLNIEPNLRPEEIEVEEFVRIYEKMEAS